MADVEQSILSRIFSRKRREPNDYESGSAPGWGDNGSQPTRTLVNKVLRDESCLLVTGYQDFLSSLSIIFETVPNLLQRSKGSIRIIFGTNTDNKIRLNGSHLPIDMAVRDHFLANRGLSVADLSDLQAIMSIDAIKAGIIDLRIFDVEKARQQLGREPAMLHAKLFISKSTVLSGSANFSIGGLRRNLEYIDNASNHPELSQARRQAAEAFWEMGRPWNEEALSLLGKLLKLCSPEEAVARTVFEMRDHKPWIVSGSRTTGRPPQVIQADMVYEAAGTIHEHGFAFVEAPTGAGKTDIGKHLAVTLSFCYSQSIPSWGTQSDHMRNGSLALIPPRVEAHWKRNAPTVLTTMCHSALSQSPKDEQAMLDEIRRIGAISAAMIVDESHLLHSRLTAPSKRSEIYEQISAVPTACLSATILGNHGIDGALAYHEKRASIYVPPNITGMIDECLSGVRDHIERVRKTKVSLNGSKAAAPQQMSLFDEPQAVIECDAPVLAPVLAFANAQEHQVSLLSQQEKLADILGPYIIRRQRSCIGQSADRKSGVFRYPPMRNERRDLLMDVSQRAIVARLSTMVDAVRSGSILRSMQLKRTEEGRVLHHDRIRIHVRNLLALLRASVTVARENWQENPLLAQGQMISGGRFGDFFYEDDEDDPAVGAQRGRRSYRSLGDHMREAEKSCRRLQIPSGQIPQELNGREEFSSLTPLTDRIGTLLNHPDLDHLDDSRARQMVEAITKHRQVVFVAERLAVLRLYASKCAEILGNSAEIFIVDSAAKTPAQAGLDPDNTSGIITLTEGRQAPEYFSLDGAKSDKTKQRAIFLTYQMAEGINLQMASALGMIGVTSDIKSMIQALGRIDRIDSPHSAITYYVYDTPGLILSSDMKACDRIQDLALISGMGADDIVLDLENFAAADIVDHILTQINRPRSLRANNYFDILESISRDIPEDLTGIFRRSRPVSCWGSHLCRLSSSEEMMIIALGSTSGDIGTGLVFPPRLLAVELHSEHAQIIGCQETAANLLRKGWTATKEAGLHKVNPTINELNHIMGQVREALPHITQWDIRPARTLSLLESLARFLTKQPVQDEGRALFGHLTLPCLIKLSDLWAQELDPSWISAKRSVRAATLAGRQIPNYVGMHSIESEFNSQAEDVRELIHQRMSEHYERFSEHSRSEPIDILNRIAVIFGSVRPA